MDQIMESYNLLVPNIYTPEPVVMQELIQAADAVGDMTQIPRFWSDIVAFDQTDREQLLALVLDTLVRNEPDPGSSLVESFSKIAEQIWEKIENQPANRVNVIRWVYTFFLSHIYEHCLLAGQEKCFPTSWFSQREAKPSN